MIRLDNVNRSVLIEFIEGCHRPEGLKNEVWAACLLHLTAVPTAKIAEAVNRTPSAVRGIWRREKEYIASLDDAFVQYFVRRANEAHGDALKTWKRWAKTRNGSLPKTYPKEFDFDGLLHPRVLVCALEYLKRTKPLPLIFYLPLPEGELHKLRALLLKTLFADIRKALCGKGDKDNALLALRAIEESWKDPHWGDTGMKEEQK